MRRVAKAQFLIELNKLHQFINFLNFQLQLDLTFIWKILGKFRPHYFQKGTSFWDKSITIFFIAIFL